MNTTDGHTRLVSTPGGLTGNAFSLAGLPQGGPMSCFIWISIADFTLSHANTTPGLGVQLAGADEVPSRTDPIYAKARAYADDIIAFGTSTEEVTKTAEAMVDALGLLNIRVQAKKCISLRNAAAAAEDATATLDFTGLQVQGNCGAETARHNRLRPRGCLAPRPWLIGASGSDATRVRSTLHPVAMAEQRVTKLRTLVPSEGVTRMATGTITMIDSRWTKSKTKWTPTNPNNPSGLPTTTTAQKPSSQRSKCSASAPPDDALRGPAGDGRARHCIVNELHQRRTARRAQGAPQGTWGCTCPSPAGENNAAT
jgi:hypothetical protein